MRHERQEALDRMLRRSRSSRAQKDMKTRQHLGERSFARSTRYGYKRARWRGLRRVQIQDFLIATVQNIMVFIRYWMNKFSKSKGPINKAINFFYDLFMNLRFYLKAYWIQTYSTEACLYETFGQQPVKV